MGPPGDADVGEGAEGRGVGAVAETGVRREGEERKGLENPGGSSGSRPMWSGVHWTHFCFDLGF